MHFTTIFFDIDYCILDTPTSKKRIIHEMYAQHGQQIEDNVCRDYQEINRQLWVLLDTGKLDRQRLYVKRFEELFKMHPINWNAKEAAPWFLDKLACACDPQPGAAHLLARLKDAGAHIFTASNGIGEVMNKRVELAGLSDYLDGKFAADDIGAMKPSHEYFDRIFQKSGETKLENTLMVGDNPVTDVNGAVAYGMTGALFGARWLEPSNARYRARTMAELEKRLFEEDHHDHK